MITLEPPQGTGRQADRQAMALSPAGLGRFLRAAQRAAGLEGEVQVLLADDATLKRLNRTFRGKNKPTDVLSFPAAPGIGFFAVPDVSAIAGDIAISLDAAARQATEYGHSLRDEVRILILHGVLHLAGYDHEADTGEMAAREDDLRRKLRLPAALIARAGASPRLPGKKKTPPRNRPEVRGRA